MQAGDILLQVGLEAEPSSLFQQLVVKHGVFPPLRAAVAIRRQKLPLDEWRDGFQLDSITAADRSRADISLSKISLGLSSQEIADAAGVNEILWKWVARGEAPSIKRAMPFLTVTTLFSGAASSLLDEIEADPVSASLTTVRVTIGMRDPKSQGVKGYELRLIAAAEGTALMLGDVEGAYRAMLAPGQEAALRECGRRVNALFDRRSRQRRDLLKTRATEVLGPLSVAWLNTAPRSGSAPIHDLAGDAFGQNMRRLHNKQMELQRTADRKSQNG